MHKWRLINLSVWSRFSFIIAFACVRVFKYSLPCIVLSKLKSDLNLIFCWENLLWNSKQRIKQRGSLTFSNLCIFSVTNHKTQCKISAIISIIIAQCIYFFVCSRLQGPIKRKRGNKRKIVLTTCIKVKVLLLQLMLNPIKSDKWWKSLIHYSL